MRTLGRFAAGALAAFCLMWLSAFAYSLLMQRLPISRNWWDAHAAAIYGAEIVAFVPFALGIALVLRKLFPRRAAASAFACTLVAAAALFFPTAVASYRYDVLWLTLRANADFILAFVVGAPLLVLVIQRWRTRSS
jgi:hypothetical protein